MPPPSDHAECVRDRRFRAEPEGSRSDGGFGGPGLAGFLGRRRSLDRRAGRGVGLDLQFSPDVRLGLDAWFGFQLDLVIAFGRAAELAPDHPGPPYFLGLAYAQGGQMDQAVEIWTRLLARSPADAPWRAQVEARLAEVQQMSAAPPRP